MMKSFVPAVFDGPLWFASTAQTVIDRRYISIVSFSSWRSHFGESAGMARTVTDRRYRLNPDAADTLRMNPGSPDAALA